jgi:hypothetical protein
MGKLARGAKCIDCGIYFGGLRMGDICADCQAQMEVDLFMILNGRWIDKS